jgi:putative ABC transport system permease protein
VNLLSFRIPLRFLRRNYGRTALIVMAVALGVALVCALDLVTRSMQLAFEEIIDTMAGRAALEVSAGEVGLVPDEVAAQIGRLPGVELAVPVVRATAFLTDGSGEALTVHGVDVLNEDALRVYEARDPDGQTIDDPVRFLADPRGVILTRTFAERHGIAEGESIELDTPRGRRGFPVLRLLEPQGVARVYGGNLIVMDVAAAEDLFTRPGFVSRIDVAVQRQANLEAVRSSIEAVLPHGLQVTTPAQRKFDLQKVMRSFGVLLRGIGLVGVVIAYLIAFNAMSSAFERRGWQLGVLAAIGARPGTIWRLQMQEALLLATASIVLGLGVGIALAHVLLPVIATATALNFNLIAPQARLTPSTASLAIAVSLGIGVTLLAAWLPATRAVRDGIATTIRGRGKEPLSSEGRPGWAMAVSLWAGAIAAVMLQSISGWVGFGLAATALVAAAIAASASPIIPLAARGVLPILVRVAGGSGRLAATGLRDHPRRVGLTTATIAVGVASVAWLWILARSFEGSVVDALGRAIRADLVVTSTNIGAGFLEAPLHGDVLTAVREVPGIEAAAGWRALEWPYQGEAIGLSAYDPDYFRDTRFGEWPLKAADSSDVWERVARGEGVVVSTSFVASFGKGVGERLVLDTPTGPLDLPILGVTVDFVAPKGTVEMSREVFSARWVDSSVTRIFALKQAPVALADLRQRISAQLGARYRLRVLSAGELLDYFVSQVRRAFSVIPLFAGTVYLVILIGLASSLVTSVLDRRRELAIVRAIGLRARLARRVVVLESLVVGCIGLALAAVGGLLLATLWVRRTFQLLLGWALDVQVPGPQLLLLGLAALVVCYVASLVPARRAETLEVSEALRYE